MSVTAVLLNWRRPWNIEPIVHEISSHVDEIIIWDNSGRLGRIAGATVIESQENCGTYGRYLAAQCAEHDVIYTQDDDVLVRNVPFILGLLNESIVAGLTRGHYRAEAHKKPWILLGWGSVFRREWLDAVEPWRERYGEDHLLKSKFDRIFTILWGKHHPIRADVERLKNPDGRRSEMDANSLYRQTDHHPLVREATEKSLEIKNAAR